MPRPAGILRQAGQILAVGPGAAGYLDGLTAGLGVRRGGLDALDQQAGADLVLQRSVAARYASAILLT